MSICIAARAVHAGKEQLVLCADSQVGDDQSTWEGEKFDIDLSERLMVLCAGSLEDSKDLVFLYKRRLDGRALGLGDLREELWVGMKEFKSDLSRRRSSSKTDVQLLVCGFVEGSASVIYVDHRQVFECQQFAAIGSGGTCADAMFRWRMATHKLDPFQNSDDVKYFVYEAKKFGELSPHVGKDKTHIMIVEPSPVGHLAIDWLSPVHLEFLAGEFQKYGPQTLPDKRQHFG